MPGLAFWKLLMRQRGNQTLLKPPGNTARTNVTMRQQQWCVFLVVLKGFGSFLDFKPHFPIPQVKKMSAPTNHFGRSQSTQKSRFQSIHWSIFVTQSFILIPSLEQTSCGHCCKTLDAIVDQQWGRGGTKLTCRCSFTKVAKQHCKLC